MTKRVALVTGASSGIGAATVRALAAAGFDTVAAARRVERCEELAREVGGRAFELDVTDDASVAGPRGAARPGGRRRPQRRGALGLDPVEKARRRAVAAMYDANVLGVLRVHQALLPKLRASGNGHVVVLGSIAGFEVYPGGAGYTGVKHAVNALCRTLRLELVGEPIRITEVAPGMVETEFSLVRFGGDAERAAAVYQGLTPLTAQDVADVVAFCVTRPPHVDVDLVVVKPVAQASATVSARRET